MEKKGFDFQMLSFELDRLKCFVRSTVFNNDEHKLAYYEVLLDLVDVVDDLRTYNDYFYGNNSNE